MTNIDIISKLLDDRLKQHKDNLEPWKSGKLNATEPEVIERRSVMDKLIGSIGELEFLKIQIKIIRTK